MRDETFPKETAATSAQYYPLESTSKRPSAGTYPVAQEIATIFANHGDRLTVTIGAHSTDLLVDGEGPDFSSITPEDNTVTRSSRLTFSFEVRDEDSGLRHDGEAVITPDGDYTEINPDGDPVLDGEPLSVDARSSVPTNGAAADINVNEADNDMDGEAAAYTDISASGEWRKAVSRAGVAYEFTAGGRSYNGSGDNNGSFLYQLTAKDRAGNMTVTDAVADETGKTADEPFVFRVDNNAPDLKSVRTGIGYNTSDNKEEADRNFIALEFVRDPDATTPFADALASVNTSNITVVGSTIVGVVHPSKAPEVNRGEKKASTPPTGSAPKVPAKPDVVQKPAASVPAIVTTPPSPRSHLTLAITCGLDTEPTLSSPGAATIEVTSEITNATTQETAYCALWEGYRKYLMEQAAYNTAKTAYDNFTQYEKENPGEDITGGYIAEPRARIYLELAEDLAPDAQPSVIVVGGAVTDLAGNTNDAATFSGSGIQDWIAPTLTVTVTGTAADRPVVKKGGSFTVDVRSDEDLTRRPAVYFVGLRKTTGGYEIADAPSAASSLTLQEDENHWAKKYKSSQSPMADTAGLYGVIVLAKDSAGNSGATAGWALGKHRSAPKPMVNDELDLTKMDAADLLIEVDTGKPTGAGAVTPRSDGDGKETESANPFVKLTFDMEENEYAVCPTTGCTTNAAAAFKDSHSTVTVTSVTVNGVNAMADLSRVKATEFSVAARDLAVGKHKVAYTAVDDAGNEHKGEFPFEVKERQPYKVAVTPGWNLVSLPATPVDSAIGSVFSGTMYITPVLGYQQGDWVTGIREADDTWRGRLETIEGGYGYWVHARTFQTISTMLSEPDPAATLPTVPVTSGWNLLGVLDIFQNDAGDPPGAAGANGIPAANHEADNYFSSIPWKVAYTYDTTSSLWVKTTPEDGSTETRKEILNGQGYWVWSPEPSTLVP